VLGNLLKTPDQLNEGRFGHFKSGQNWESRPRACQFLEQPSATINYGEANCQANQDYDGASEKEFLYHNHQALT